MDSTQQSGDDQLSPSIPIPATPAEEVNPELEEQARFAELLAESIRYPAVTYALLAANVLVFVVVAICGVNVVEPTSWKRNA